MQDIERLKASPSLRVTEGPENRTIFFGIDVGSKELALVRREGQEPVRRRARAPGDEHGDQPRGDPARRDARPVGAGRRDRPPFVNGYTKEIRHHRPRVDVAKAKALLAEAGYPNGFSVSLHCPNDRYLNDEAICQAAVGMLGQIGIKVNLVSQSKSLHFPLLQKPEVGLLPARLGRADLRQRIHLQLSLPHARQTSSAAGTRRATPIRRPTS